LFFYKLNVVGVIVVLSYYQHALLSFQI